MVEISRAHNFIREFGPGAMKSLRKTVWMASLLLWAISLAQLNAQTPQQSSETALPQQNQPAPPQEGGQTKMVISVNQVIVPVTVKDEAGRLVPDLRRDEFRIFEDNVEQKIAFFRAEAVPLSMVLLIDNDLKSKDARQVADSLRAIVAGLSLTDETFVCRFDQFFHQGKGFVTDQDKLLTELKRTALDEQPSVGPAGGPLSEGPVINGHSATSAAPNTAGTTLIIKGQPTKALDDAVYAAAQLLKDRGRDRRKIILLISDGVNAPKFNKFDYDTTLKELLRNDITVYGVGVGSAYFDRRFERLSRYARDTGGDVYYGLKSRAMEQLYAKVTEEARNQYTLAYAPAGTDRGAEYHAIEVRVERTGLTIRTREGYYTGATPR
ncbi:MAG: VWA domain-containing protein [Proteobacteria bacterium]|nr:VWA domain-containing protein [Pseudomonadota bacterium]